MIERGTRELDRADEPGSVVPCPLRAHQPIAMGRCVEYQRDNGCHCEHALIALRRTEKFLQEPHSQRSVYDATAIADQLDGVRALISRAEQIPKARPPAPVPAPPPVPMAPAKVVQKRLLHSEIRPLPSVARCEIDGCGKDLRVNNLSGLCQEHRQQVPSRKRAGLVSSAARAAGTAGNLVQRAQPKEAFMANTCSTCSKKIRIGRDGVRHDKCLGCRRDAGEAGDGHRPAKAPTEAKPTKPTKPRRVNGKRRPRSLDDVAARHAPPSAPPADIVGLLQRQLDHHQEQADKCKRALAALQ